MTYRTNGRWNTIHKVLVQEDLHYELQDEWQMEQIQEVLVQEDLHYDVQDE